MPGRARIFYNLELIYQYLDNPAKADSLLINGVELEPINQGFIYALADFFSKSGNSKKAAFWINT